MVNGKKQTERQGPLSEWLQVVQPLALPAGAAKVEGPEFSHRYASIF